jgi:hypothetical protein
MVKFFRHSFKVIAAQRRVAVTASRGWLGAQVAEAQDEIEEDREEREDIVDTSDTIDSGDDAEEVERAREDRRVKGGIPSKLPGLLVGKGRVSIARRDMHMF